MFDSYLIEIEDREAGILLREGSDFVFHAVDPLWRAFEGTRHRDPGSAERALRRGRPPAAPPRRRAS